FGISGTNAHIILEQAPPQAPVTEPVTPHSAIPWLLSARSPEALTAWPERLRPYTDRPAATATALATRTAFEHRAAIIGHHPDDFTHALTDLVPVHTTPTRPVFVFPGQGAQWPGMGTELLTTSPVFHDTITRCQTALDPHIDWSLTHAMADPELLERVDVVQPTLFAVMTALAELWRHHGIQPTAVIGHSQGEIAAAHIAGALTLDDAARIVALRSKLIATTLTGHGGMLSLATDPTTTQTLLTPWNNHLSIAAVNGPNTTIVSGTPQALDELTHTCHTHNIRTRRIAVDYASHSPQVETLRQELLTALTGIQPRPSTIPFYSTLTTTPLDTTTLDPTYWYQNLRHTVQFHTTTQNILTHQPTTFIEISPHPVLTPSIAETIDTTTTPATTLTTLHRNQGTLDRITTSLAQAWTHGHDITWHDLLPTTTPTDIPTYPFQHQHYWLDHPTTNPTNTALTTPDHPFLQTCLELADTDGLILTGRISPHTHPWLTHHTLQNTTILPGTALAELAIQA
ncbi:acyltransferase domain-containing protein, partial [Kitasatospora sp. NPDC057500]|uniref:acyltransferase domain-containing protein n=1 Tax=Kitasatospora sp. NPDC057500 TaxID=3346151 RepID=UPI0036B2C7B2